MMRFKDPEMLALLALLVPLLWIWYRERTRPRSLLHADLRLFGAAPPTWRVRARHLPRIFRVLFLLLAALALARPQSGVRHEQITTHGVDIVVAIDRSGSMRALDFAPDRLGAAKRTITEFSAGRPNDRLGLVVFARDAYTACPLTLDHPALLALVDDVDFAPRESDGTAIGLGLASAVGRLDSSDAESRVAILVTDGVNNAGNIAPLTAAALAKELDIRVYTIGVGTRGFAPTPMMTPSGRTVIRQAPVEIDEEALREIADLTGGRYFRADEEGKLDQIFATIDQLETSEIESDIYTSWADRFEPLLLAAGLLFLAEILLARVLLGKLP